MKLNATKLFGRKGNKGYYVGLTINGRNIYDQDLIQLIVRLLDNPDISECIEQDKDFDVYI